MPELTFVSLAVNPQAAASVWLQQARDALQHANITYQANGLIPYGYHLLAAELTGEEPEEPEATPLAANASAATIARWTDNKQNHAAYITAMLAIRTPMAQSLGPAISDAIGHPVHGLTNVTIAMMIAYVRRTFMAASADHLAFLHEEAKKDFTVADVHTFAAESAAKIRVFATLATLGDVLSEVTQVRILGAACRNNATLTLHANHYLANTPLMANQTAAGLIAMVKVQLGSGRITAGAAGYVSAITTNMVMVPPEKLAAFRKWEASGSSATQSAPSGARNTSRYSPKDKPNTNGPADAPFYCYVHGHNISHTGVDCRVMTKQPYTDAQKKRATGAAP